MGTPLNEEESPAVAKVRRMLNRKLRIKVIDGRVFYGYFNCFDKQGNIILINATECRPSAGGLGGDETGETEAGVVGGGGSGSAGGPETAAELAFGTDKERHVGSVLILPEHRVETHVFDDDGGGGGGPGADDAAGGLVNLSLVDHPPPGVNRII